MWLALQYQLHLEGARRRLHSVLVQRPVRRIENHPTRFPIPPHIFPRSFGFDPEVGMWAHGTSQNSEIYRCSSCGAKILFTNRNPLFLYTRYLQNQPQALKYSDVLIACAVCCVCCVLCAVCCVLCAVCCLIGSCYFFTKSQHHALLRQQPAHNAHHRMLGTAPC